MTLTEVLIALALMALVVAPLYGSIRSAFGREALEQQRADREAQLRLVSSLIADDIRELAPSSERTSSPSEELVLEFTDSSGAVQRISWVVVGDELRRRVSDGTSVRSDVVMLEGLDVTNPLFRYWGADAGEIVRAPELASCSVRVTVDLVVSSANGETSDRSFDVAHRVPNTEAEPCAP